ncbi:MAG: hypothetical protein QWI73_04295 [Alphaproteobacteria bacterium]|nr:hypothetical protein [Alphaproteobacteria bacterium]
MTEIEETNIPETAPESESPAAQPQNDVDSLWQNFEHDVQEYKSKVPDFTEAFGYLLARRDAQLAAYGAIDKRLSDPAARAAQLENEALQVLTQAAQAGVSPAEFMYNMAKTQGYGQAANMAADYEQKSKTRSAAKSLTLSAGGAGVSPMNIESLAALPQEEFDAWYWQNKDEFKRIMGR